MFPSNSSPQGGQIQATSSPLSFFFVSRSLPFEVCSNVFLQPFTSHFFSFLDIDYGFVLRDNNSLVRLLNLAQNQTFMAVHFCLDISIYPF